MSSLRTFEEWFKDYEKYKKEHRGEEPPVRYVTPEGHALGKWCKKIRDHSKLTTEQTKFNV